MKNLNWKQWTAIGLIIALVITILVLHLTQPVMSFAWVELFTFISFIAGGVTGYFLKSKQND